MSVTGGGGGRRERGADFIARCLPAAARVLFICIDTHEYNCCVVTTECAGRSRVQGRWDRRGWRTTCHGTGLVNSRYPVARMMPSMRDGTTNQTVSAVAQWTPFRLLTGWAILKEAQGTTPAMEMDKKKKNWLGFQRKAARTKKEKKGKERAPKPSANPVSEPPSPSQGHPTGPVQRLHATARALPNAGDSGAPSLVSNAVLPSLAGFRLDKEDDQEGAWDEDAEEDGQVRGEGDGHAVCQQQGRRERNCRQRLHRRRPVRDRPVVPLAGYFKKTGTQA